MDSHPKTPSVYDYLDVGSYLQDYYRLRKTRDKNFSYESWAQELELNSRSFLRLLVAGKKKISPRFMENFCRLNFATKNEESYFYYLVKYSQASSGKDRQLYSQKMMQILKHEHSAQIVSEKVDYVSDPLLVRLLSLLCFSDLRGNAARCAKILKVEMSEIEVALSKLEAMKLAEKVKVNEEDVWVALSDVFHVPDDYGSFNLMRFHEKSLQDAVAAFSQPPQLRRYKSLFVPLSEADLEKFNRALEDFIAEQLLLYNSKFCLDTYLYQVNFNFHPVTRKMDSAVLEDETAK
ncbi:TIGR02147 family protein [Bdellovibrio sp. HCB337]|uniref:TIGR02147 family protein n=1 Tax=Bdellovibrio sp. HCB337 TaxID=3394358 RepID=UPI0039A61E99